MKILDATTVIAICSEIDYPELLEKIGLLGHVLAIPSHIVESELLDKNTRKIMAKYVQSNKIQILKKNTVQEIREFQKDFPGLGMGESDSMLAYQKLQDAGERVYCILDDGKARKKATDLGIRFTGLIGLLKMMKQKNVMSHDEIDKVVNLLKDSNFRLPVGVVI